MFAIASGSAPVGADAPEERLSRNLSLGSSEILYRNVLFSARMRVCGFLSQLYL